MFELSLRTAALRRSKHTAGNSCRNAPAGSPACPARLESDDQPSSRAAGLHPTIGVGRPFRRIDLRHAKRDYAGLDLAPEPVALLELKRVVAHPGGREADIPLRGAQEAANRGEGAAVANRGA